MLRATFFSVFQQRAISYSRDNDRINITVPLNDTQYFCLAKLVVYRTVSSVGNDIAIGASGLGFLAWASQSGHSVTTAATLLRTWELCCAGAKPRRWAPPLITRLVAILTTKCLLRVMHLMRCQALHHDKTRLLIEQAKHVKKSRMKLSKEPHAARELRVGHP